MGSKYQAAVVYPVPVYSRLPGPRVASATGHNLERQPTTVGVVGLDTIRRHEPREHGDRNKGTDGAEGLLGAGAGYLHATLAQATNPPRTPLHDKG
jgi:hypothetical protein